MNRRLDARRVLLDPWTRRRVLVGLVALALTAFPLVGTLGYEHAFVLGPVFSCLGVALGVDLVGRRRRLGRSLTPWGLMGEAVAELAGWGVATIALSLVGGLWQPGCDPWGGVRFFGVGPMLGGALGAVCGVWGAALAERRGRALLVGLVPFAACTVIGLARLYVHPVVFAFDPFWGYFSGSIYDEAVAVDQRYLAFRAYNLAGATAALLAFSWLVEPTSGRLRKPPRDRRSLGLGVLTLAIASATASVGFRPARYRFSATTESIAGVLAGTYVSEHFIIHYQPRSADARSIDALALEHEYAWSRLYGLTAREPPTPVHSFVFANAEQKRALMGAGRVQVAAPWRNQIYLDHRQFPHPVLHHELAHVFAATIGDDLLGISRDGLSINFGLIEGLATALAPRPNDRLDLHDEARVLLELDRLPSLAAIMGPGFFGSASRTAYVAAGSLCLWLIETRGFEPMADLYRTAGDFEAAYATDLATLEPQWIAFLRARQGVRPEDVAAQAERFAATAVWARPCAHVIAAVAREINRALGRGDLERAIIGHRELCTLEPESPFHQLSLARALARAEAYDEAATVLDALATTPNLSVTVQAQILERRGDVALKVGDLPAAFEHYAAALARPVSENQVRVLRVKQRGAADPTLAPWVLDYFAPFDVEDDSLVRAVSRFFAATQIRDAANHRALGDYLVARQLLNVQRPADAIGALVRSLEGSKVAPSAAPVPHDRLEDPEFVRAARLALLQAAVQTGDYALARRTLADLQRAPELGNGHRLEHAQWDQRIDFFEANAQAAVGAGV